MDEPLADAAETWTRLGSTAPMWAALTDGGREEWSEAAFLATGEDEISGVLGALGARQFSVRRGTALDFGCGPGRLTLGLARQGFGRVIGVDVSAPMLEQARRLVTDPRCEFLLNTSGDLGQVDSASIDFVYSCRVLQHVHPDLARSYIREFFRVVTPGGCVVFQIPFEPEVGIVGLTMRVVPDAVLTRARKGMRMFGMAPDDVTSLIAASGAVTIAIDRDTSAGPRWRSFKYFAKAGG
ncbi:MAG: class I SAM-dependent methyltransferase [Ilumatobacteraceae bacterium]